MHADPGVPLLAHDPGRSTHRAGSVSGMRPSGIVFPSVDRLPSTASADGSAPSLFGGFSGTTRSSDFPRACMPDVTVIDLLRPTRRTIGEGARGISRFPCEGVSTHAQGLRLRGVRGRLADDAAFGVAFRLA